jgi:hypothetical protein
LVLWWSKVAFVTGHTAPASFSVSCGWVGGRYALTGPTIGQVASVIEFLPFAFLRAGHALAS